MKFERQLLLPQQMEWALKDFFKKKPAVKAAQLARQAGLSIMTVYFARHGKTKPSIETCLAIGKVMAEYGYNLEKEIWGDEQ